MNGGRIEQIGAPEEIYQNPNTEFVARFVGAANLLEGCIVPAADGDDSGLRHVAVNGVELKVLSRGQTSGASCRVAIHPESIELRNTPPMAGQPNSFAATITDLYFLGHFQEIHIRAEQLVLRVMDVGGRRFRVGETVCASIPPSTVLLF
jgi:iron(III) transport system ATP-binding protein